MIRPQASKNLIFLTILLAFTLYASFVLAVQAKVPVANAVGIASAPTEGPRYFIKTTNPFWQRSFGVRHDFDDGFTTDLSGIQLTLAKLFGLEVEPVSQLHVLPVHVLPEGIIDNPKPVPAPSAAEPSPSVDTSNKPVEKPSGKSPVRAVPTDQTPWGVELIYNDPVINSTLGGLGTNVAVLDTGVLKTHPDLKNRVKQCKDFTNLRTPVKDGICSDLHGHGTHVSGIILADAGSDKLGIYGVAPEAGLFSYKVCGNDGACWADDIAYAIRVAANNGTNVINMSLGADTESSLIKNAIDYAVSKDVLIVAAAGNDGPYPASIDYPAANLKVVAVGAIDVGLLVPDWSSQGINSSTSPYIVEERDMEFGAPGVNVESTWKNGGYAILSGTSMASPHVTGLAAKLWQSAALEGTRALATRDLLHQLAKDIWTIGDDNATGFGLPQISK